MKVYFYFSKNKISKINNVNFVKESIAKSIIKEFSLLETIQNSDISVRCAKISNDIDVFLIIDSNPLGGNRETAIAMNRVKNTIKGIIQADQSSQLTYKVTYKIEKNHLPMGNEYVGGTALKNNSDNMPSNSGEEISELDYMERAKAYVPVDPAYSFDRVILPDDVLEKIESAINILRYEKKVFQEWGLYEIQPNPSSALSFFGPSGTGKTMAAEAIAEKLGKKILKVSYADVESKYHGEGPKMVKAIFLAAEKEDAVLFFDEADSLLSKRLTNVSQGSEQAINSMRSQLLICLEEFKGVVIFATNLVVNYDNAFLTRLISVEFKNPDVATRKRIWDVHVKSSVNKKLNIPLSEDVDTGELAEKYEFAGREIRNAVISACVNVAMNEREIVRQEDFITACNKIVEEKVGVANASDHTKISEKGKDALKQVFMEKIKEGAITNISTVTE